MYIKHIHITLLLNIHLEVWKATLVLIWSNFCLTFKRFLFACMALLLGDRLRSSPANHGWCSHSQYCLAVHQHLLGLDSTETTQEKGDHILIFRLTHEGLPGVLGNKGTLAKYWREQRNITQFLGTREQNSKNYSTKMCGKYENAKFLCLVV